MKFGVQNVRRLVNIEPVEIKPITLLVGRNSGGKSSFLRMFPLLRQSLMTRTSAPILWYGDLVDFGSFDTAIHRASKSAPIELTFQIDSMNVERQNFYIFEDTYLSGGGYGITPFTNVTYKTSIIKNSDGSRVSHICINCEDPQLDISLDINDRDFVTKICIDGIDRTDLVKGMNIITDSGTIFSEIRFQRTTPGQKLVRLSHLDAFPVSSKISEIVKEISPKRYTDRKIAETTLHLAELNAPNKDELADHIKKIAPGAHKAYLADFEAKDSIASRLQALLVMAILPNLTRNINSKLQQTILSTLYIGPMRARSERYYRLQDLAVSEIDPDGKNFAMFLNSLTAKQLESLSSWINSLFGYGISISKQTGHISINLKEAHAETNVVDVGYGVSQILPVLGQIWWARQNTRRVVAPYGPSTQPTQKSRRPSILAIEQPELHLHPAHQALLADALVGETSTNADGEEKPNPTCYLVETHSETLVNRIGELIAKNRISEKDVQVLLFEADDTNESTSIRTVNFDSNGSLIDWPYGFFQPSVI